MDEAAEVKLDKAKPQPNSGRRIYGKDKGDAKLGPFVYDIKEYAKAFSVNMNSWSKVCTDAIKAGGEPALKIVLGSGRNTVRLWVVSDAMFKQMLEAWEDKYA